MISSSLLKNSFGSSFCGAMRHGNSLFVGYWRGGIPCSARNDRFRSLFQQAARDVYSLYVEEYIGLYLKILKTNDSATLYARFIKAQVSNRQLSAIKIRFNKGLVGWGSRGVQLGVHSHLIRPFRVTIPVGRLVCRSLP
jgi:hypothetical protein